MKKGTLCEKIHINVKTSAFKCKKDTGNNVKKATLWRKEHKCEGLSPHLCYGKKHINVKKSTVINVKSRLVHINVNLWRNIGMVICKKAQLCEKIHIFMWR